MPLQLALLGAGRIGQTHAMALAGLGDARLTAVYDPVTAAAERVSQQSGAIATSIDQIIADPAIDGVLICTPTDLHADLIEQAANAGKAIFCEKPIDLDADRVRACLDVVKRTQARLMVGFNRRFDPHFASVRARINRGEIGEVELIQITSRDPEPPPLAYINRSGGLFRDMMIHDFDMARFLLNEEPVEVSATASVLIDKAIGQAGDVDTAAATLRTASGKIAIITNSRRATYGYDQRIEVHGSAGMVSAGNLMETTVTTATAEGYRSDPLLTFFIQRYHAAYRAELSAFVASIRNNTPPAPNGIDGLQALLLADAANQSVSEGRTIRLAD